MLSWYRKLPTTDLFPPVVLVNVETPRIRTTGALENSVLSPSEGTADVESASMSRRQHWYDINKISPMGYW